MSKTPQPTMLEGARKKLTNLTASTISTNDYLSLNLAKSELPVLTECTKHAHWSSPKATNTGRTRAAEGHRSVLENHYKKMKMEPMMD
jgi:hypothetical protein